MIQTEKALDLEGFFGVVQVDVAGETEFSYAGGCAELANGIPNALDTRFGTASMGKGFVATAILKLIEQGRLRLTDTLGDIQPFPLHRIDPRVTIAQLLTHTSTVPDYFDESVMDEYEELWVDFPCYRIRKSEDLLPLFYDKEPTDNPEGHFCYNNSGFVVLDLVLQKLTGLPFDQALRRDVFGPLGMTDTGYFEMDALPARCASAYIWDEGRDTYRTNIFSVDTKGTGAGGAFTTVKDLSRFWHGLYGGFLDKGLLKEATTQQSDGEYGYGYWLYMPGDVVHIEGCDPGITALSTYDPARDRVVTALSNFGHDTEAMVRKLL